METKTTRIELQELRNTSLIPNTSAELFNATDLQNADNSDSPMLYSHSGSEYNLNESSASMSGRIFVLSYSGKPLTPCKNGKARKMIYGGVAQVVWNKFGEFGIKMLIPTREETPKTILGIDNGTKFEGYSLIVGNETTGVSKEVLKMADGVVDIPMNREPMAMSASFRVSSGSSTRGICLGSCCPSPST